LAAGDIVKTLQGTHQNFNFSSTTLSQALPNKIMHKDWWDGKGKELTQLAQIRGCGIGKSKP